MGRPTCETGNPRPRGLFTRRRTQPRMERRRGGIMAERTVGEIMTKEVVTAATEDEVAALAKRMAQERISCVVIMGGRKPVGIVSERDIVRVVAERPALIVGMKARE